MSKTFNTNETLARAAALAVERTENMAKAPTTKKAPAPVPKADRIQFNVHLNPESRRKIKNVCFAWGITERELIENFVAQLPDVSMPNVAAPASVAWAKPKTS